MMTRIDWLIDVNDFFFLFKTLTEGGDFQNLGASNNPKITQNKNKSEMIQVPILVSQNYRKKVINS